MNKPKIKLSIVLLTYNHEKYIAQALESILMQKVDFDYEVIVCEDCSTDKTRDIILQYANKFKNIKLCFNKKKLWCSIYVDDV
jgi:glycosyltransferase involved in cell wall biosynthesis